MSTLQHLDSIKTMAKAMRELADELDKLIEMAKGFTEEKLKNPPQEVKVQLEVIDKLFEMYNKILGGL